MTEAYARDGFAFVARVLAQPSVLEDMTGLTELKRAMDARLLDMETDEPDDWGSDQDATEQPAAEDDF